MARSKIPNLMGRLWQRVAPAVRGRFAAFRPPPPDARGPDTPPKTSPVPHPRPTPAEPPVAPGDGGAGAGAPVVPEAATPAWRVRPEPSPTARFHGSLLIAEVLALHPGAAEVLARHHLAGCPACALNPLESLEEGTRTHGIDLARVLADLEALGTRGSAA